MTRETIENCELILGSMEDTIGSISYVDHILTDPPYLYLSQDFDKKFDEKLLFENAKRLLPDDGLIAIFGRGTSFYRWNTLLADIGFIFNEEIVWDKLRSSGPNPRLARMHETISIHTKKNGLLNKGVRVPYTDFRQDDLSRIDENLKRIQQKINSNGLEQLSQVLKNKKVIYDNQSSSRHSVNYAKERLTSDPCCNSLFLIENGILEQSIIRVGRCHYNTVHPTEKPVRLAERILALISTPGDTIYDPFMGSGSFGVACVNLGRKYIGSEVNPEYFEIAYKRIKETVWNKLF